MEDFGGQLRAKGLRNTPYRRAVLEAVRRSPHLSAAEIATALTSEDSAGGSAFAGASLSRQGLYNVLDDLVAASLLRSVEPAGSPARFELETHDNHHHVVCRMCGKIQDVACVVGAAPCLDPVQAPGFNVDEAEVTWWGMCSECEAVAAVKAP